MISIEIIKEMTLGHRFRSWHQDSFIPCSIDFFKKSMNQDLTNFNTKVLKFDVFRFLDFLRKSEEI